MAGSTTTPPPGFRAQPRGGRLLYHPDGRLRTGRILGAFAGAGFVMIFGTYVALVASGVGNPDVLGIAAVAILLGVKLPLLVMLWRLLGRHLERPGMPRWTAAEHREILARLEEAARASADRPDAAARLAHISREAWGIVDLTPDEGKSDAIATALRIDEMAVGART
jgi:hypothetical protein